MVKQCVGRNEAMMMMRALAMMMRVVVVSAFDAMKETRREVVGAGRRYLTPASHPVLLLLTSTSTSTSASVLAL